MPKTQLLNFQLRILLMSQHDLGGGGWNLGSGALWGSEMPQGVLGITGNPDRAPGLPCRLGGPWGA